MISVSDTSSSVDDEFAGLDRRDFRLALVNLNFLVVMGLELLDVILTVILIPCLVRDIRY